MYVGCNFFLLKHGAGKSSSVCAQIASCASRAITISRNSQRCGGKKGGRFTKILCECQISMDLHNQPQHGSDCFISDNTILIAISLFTELWKGWWFSVPGETCGIFCCLLVCSEEKILHKKRHSQNNLTSEIKAKGGTFQAHEKQIEVKAIFFHREMETILFGGMLKQPYTIRTNTM